MEICSVYGAVKHIEMLGDRFHPEFSKGFAYVEFENSDGAEKSVKHLDGGMLNIIPLSLQVPALSPHLQLK